MTATGAEAVRRAIPVEAGMRILSSFSAGGDQALSEYANCVVPLLNALGWRGDHRHVAEAVPHFSDNLDLDGFRTVLANLNFALHPFRVRQDHLEPGMLPCLFVPDVGSVRVVQSATEDGYQVYDGWWRRERQSQGRSLRGTAYIAKPVEPRQGAAKPDTENWMAATFRRFSGVTAQILLVTAMFNILSLTTPLFIMVTYDRIIPSGSTRQLLYFLAGILIALGLELAFRSLRSRSLAHVAGRIDHLIGSASFQHVLYLPAMYTETAPVGSQMARLKEFESVREFFTGPLAESLLDLPFVLLFLAVIAVIGGPLALVLLVVAMMFVALHFALAPKMRRLVSASNHVRSDLQQFLVEAMNDVRTIKFMGAETLWRDRFRRLSAEVAIADFRHGLISHLVQILGQMLMLTSGIALVAFGAMRVMDDALSMGGLIAVMALGWRALSPLQSGFLALGRSEQIRAAFRQINQLMRLAPERIPGTVPPRRFIGGSITFSFVSHRYSPESDPVLFGISFKVNQGEVVAVTGPNGSGKSTVSKLAAGLYRPQTGAVLIDGIDIRQIDPIDLRQNIGVVPQTNHFFYGTIAQNLRLAVPTATDAEIVEAAHEARVYDDIMALAEGFETRLSEQVLHELPAGFKQKLSLARAYVRQAPILILDEPAQTLDEDGDKALMASIARRRGKSTILIVTHRPSHMRLADRLVVLRAGKVQFDGPPHQFLDRPEAAA